MAIKLTDIEKQLNGLKAPNSYQTDKTLQNQITAAENNVLNRKEFSYDFNTDPFYQNYKDQYVRGGKMAMLDTQAGAAALSGGYGNSYAATAGNQAYQQYLSQLNNVIPELYDAAYNRYQNDLAQKRADLSMLMDKENQNYSRYRDTVGDYNQNREYYTGLYTNTRDYEWNDAKDKRDYAYQVAHDKIANQLQRDQLNETIRANKASEKINSAKAYSSSSSSSSKKTSIPTYITSDMNEYLSDDSASLTDIKKYLSTQYGTGAITKDQMVQLYARATSKKGSTDSEDDDGPLTWKQVVQETGNTSIRTRSEFSRGNNSDLKKYGTYDQYLQAMRKKYKK